MADGRNTGAVRLALFAVALGGLALLASPAAAQEPGLFIDPESPTAKEYSIPLERARRQADPSGASRQQPPTVRAAPLFGEGIVAQASGADGGGGQAGSGGGSEGDRRRADGSDRSTPTRRKRTAAVPDAIVAAAQQPGPPSGGIGSTLLVAGVAAIVLLAGGLGGLALRRRS